MTFYRTLKRVEQCKNVQTGLSKDGWGYENKTKEQMLERKSAKVHLIYVPTDTKINKRDLKKLLLIMRLEVPKKKGTVTVKLSKTAIGSTEL